MMKNLILATLFILLHHTCHGQENNPIIDENRKNSLYIELAGRGYFSLNYDRAWMNKNRVSFGFGWNDMETNLDSTEIIEKGVGDHEASPYLMLNSQCSRLFGKGPSFLEIGIGTVITLFDLERFRIADNLYANESNFSIYPLIGYRYEGENGLLFLFSFNPVVQIPQGYFWPIPGISLGYRF